MRITVIGSGYVGLVASACFADVGHDVICVDKDESVIARLRGGQVPIYEPGLTDLVAHNAKNRRLSFTTDLASAVRESELVFIAVGTPPLPDGSVDLGEVLEVAGQIALAMNGYKVVVTKSTVPVGTGRKIIEQIRGGTSQDFGYASNPEFLKEGAAIEDFTKPVRVVIGSESPQAIEQVKQAYMPFMRQSERFVIMDTTSAELTKYAANAMLALRISFMNEIANVCEAVSADIERVRKGVGSDPRIGKAYLFAGIGYGGFCFPKDVSALIHMGKEHGCEMAITDAIQHVNVSQRERFARRILDYFGAQVRGTVLAVWGLSYKALTDDVRESPAIWCMRRLLEAGVMVRAHDPEAMPKALRELGDRVTMVEGMYDVLEGAHGLVVFTDWREFRGADLQRIAQRLLKKVVFDGRNLYDPALMAKAGLRYICIGRP